jgi:hypothetical protein
VFESPQSNRVLYNMSRKLIEAIFMEGARRG